MSSCETKPVNLFVALDMGLSLNVMVPERLLLRRLPRALRRVVLPLPEGPRTASIWPGQTIPVMPFKIVFSAGMEFGGEA